MTMLKKSLPALMLAGALMAGTAVATPAWDSSAPLANNRMSAQQVRQLSMPLGDAGDPHIMTCARREPAVRPLKSNLTRLALAGAFVAGLEAIHPAADPATPPANSLSTEQARKLTSPVDGERGIQLHPGQPVVRNVSFQRYRP